jgi:RHS repeat-associated protein
MDVDETQVSEVDLNGQDGWVCNEMFPVNFMTGANFLTQRDLHTSGLSRFGITRMYLQDPALSDHGLGPCWRIGALYRIVQNGTDVRVIGGNAPATSFTDNLNGTYTPDFNYSHSLVADAANHLLILTDPRGRRWIFYDLSATWSPSRQGRLKEYDDRGGNITTTVYGTSGVTQDKLLELQQTDTNPAIFHRFVFSYNLSGASVGLLASITYSQTVSGITTTVRVANYSYSTSGGPNAPAGMLQRVRIADGSGNTLDTTYYRYDAADVGGWVPLRVVVLPKSYDRLLAALGSEAAIDGASDAAIAPYSDYLFQYDGQRRVTQEIVSGQGCGCGGAGGKGTFTFSYGVAAHGAPDGPNVWRFKCTETRPDGNQRVVYTNFAGQSILDLWKDAVTGNQWRKYWTFNNDYSLASKTFPSGITGHDESLPGLVSSAHLPDGSGRSHLFEYYSTTNLPAGQVAKYPSARKVRQGELGSPILLESWTYTSRSGAVATIYPLLTRTVYRNTDGTGAQTTTYGYTWQGTTTEVLQRTTTHPTVPTNQNGSGSATSAVRQYDAFGRQTWLKDEDGFIRAMEYDTLTAAMTKMIEDVNTAISTNEPAGWVTPAGGGLHLTTSTQVDILGRAVKITDPLGKISYTVFRDPQHEERHYPGWNVSINSPTGPTLLSREDRASGYTERISMSATPAVVGGIPTGTEAISGLQTLSRDYLDLGGRVTHTDSYFNPTGLVYSPAPNLGTEGTHFYRASVNYDVKGRKDRVQDWTGTITRTVYDSRDRIASTWVGTDDTPTTGDWSPTNTAGTNLIKIAANEYDGGGIGDGNLTKASRFTSAIVSLDTVFQYDFRDRETGQRGPDLVATKRTLDNLGFPVVTELFADANSDFVVGAGELRGKTEMKADEKGQIYQMIVHQVDPSTGTIGNHLTTNAWSNARGLRTKAKSPNGLFTKSSFDGAGRPVATFLSYHDAESLYDDADDVVGDTVVEQQVQVYDAASNVIQRTRYQRTSTTAKLGDLSVSWAAGQSRRTFVAEWFDLANRSTDVVDYGTNGGSNLSRPATPPLANTSDNYIVMHVDFDAAGRPYRVTDNKARVTESTFDGLGRETRTIENRIDGSVAETELDTDRTTESVYDTSGRLSQRIRRNPKGSGGGVELQTTLYVYGTVANQAVPAVYRNDLLSATIYPDSDDTYNPAGPPGSQLADGSDGTYDRVEYTYDYASRQQTLKDQRGTAHTYSFDSAGRPSADTVTTLGSGVDGSVLRIGMIYDSLSRSQTRTSASDVLGASIVNQVALTYDGWGNIIKSEEAHAGPVMGGTPAFQVAISDGASGGEAKFQRTVSATYPNGRVVYSNFPAAASVGDRLDREDNLANDASGISILAQYTYLGSRVFGRIDHPLVTNGLRLEVDPGGNPTEWDRFGRVLDQRWKRSGATFNYDRYQHTYDRTSSVLSRDVTPNNPPTGRDEFYAYDGLDRQTKINRGTLSGGQITDANANYSQSWTALESQGNWRTHVEDINGGVAGGVTTQSRTHSKANEVLTISGNTPDWIDPAHDRAGNLTSGPQPGTEATRIHFTYDAWNRLVKAQADSGGLPGATIAEYQYDAFDRRIVKLKPNGANWDRRDYYHTMAWQCIEERELLNTASKITVATTPKYQWVWDLRYIDAVVLRDENKDGDGDCVDGTDERLFYTQDANANTTALVSTAGTVVERYVYDPYGKVSVLTGTWTSQAATLYNNELLFGGYRRDPETALYQVRHRAYHPTLGRWMQRDPIGDTGGPNLYEYVGSSPAGLVDPYGLARHCGMRVVSVTGTINGPNKPFGANDAQHWLDVDFTLSGDPEDGGRHCPNEKDHTYECCAVSAWAGHVYSPDQEKKVKVDKPHRGKPFRMTKTSGEELPLSGMSATFPDGKAVPCTPGRNNAPAGGDRKGGDDPIEFKNIKKEELQHSWHMLFHGRATATMYRWGNFGNRGGADFGARYGEKPDGSNPVGPGHYVVIIPYTAALIETCQLIDGKPWVFDTKTGTEQIRMEVVQKKPFAPPSPPVFHPR